MMYSEETEDSSVCFSFPLRDFVGAGEERGLALKMECSWIFVGPGRIVLEEIADEKRASWRWSSCAYFSSDIGNISSSSKRAEK